MNGYGIFTYFDDRAYSGKIINGFMNGIGIFKWKNGNFYFGEYENDVKNGFGIYVWDLSIFQCYIGFWKNGKMNGIGIKIKDGFNIIKLKDGSYIKSTFKNKEINGIAKFYKVF